MANRFNGKLFFSILLFLMCFGFNIDKIEAAGCSCYYVWTVDAANASVTSETYYYGEVHYTNNGAKVSKFCSYGYVADNDGSREITTTATIKCKGKGIKIDSHFNIDYKKMADGKCRKSVCENGQGIYIKPNDNAKTFPGSLTTDKVKSISPRPGTIISREAFDTAIERNDNRTSSDDNYIDDITGDMVTSSDPTMEEAQVGTVSCDIIPPSIMNFLNNLFLLIQVLGIVLLVVMSLIEFVKAVTGSEKDSLNKAIKNTFKRIIITILLLILPIIIIWVLDIVNSNAYETDDNGKRIIGANGNPLCK